MVFDAYCIELTGLLGDTQAVSLQIHVGPAIFALRLASVNVRNAYPSSTTDD